MEMTISEWNNGGYHMSWSIYDEASNAEHKKMPPPEDEFDWEDPYWKAYDNILLDLRAPKGVPDGTHWVFHRGYSAEGECHGAVVRNGLFVPGATDRAAYFAVCRANGIPMDERMLVASRNQQQIDHVYIERWVWHADRQALEVRCGS